MKDKFDAFETHFAPLGSHNLGDALLASGTLPLVMEPMHGIPQAPAGTYWDGGLIDYHLALPYARIADTADGGLVLYPHFVDYLIPGWFDKPLPWRRGASGGKHDWLDNMLLVSPSRAFLHTLTRGKLPDRHDFIHYGLDHNFRILNWQLAIGEGQRLRDEFAAFAENPDLSRVNARAIASKVVYDQGLKKVVVNTWELGFTVPLYERESKWKNRSWRS